MGQSHTRDLFCGEGLSVFPSLNSEAVDGVETVVRYLHAHRRRRVLPHHIIIVDAVETEVARRLVIALGIGTDTEIVVDEVDFRLPPLSVHPIPVDIGCASGVELHGENLTVVGLDMVRISHVADIDSLLTGYDIRLFQCDIVPSCVMVPHRLNDALLAVEVVFDEYGHRRTHLVGIGIAHLIDGVADIFLQDVFRDVYCRTKLVVVGLSALSTYRRPELVAVAESESHILRLCRQSCCREDCRRTERDSV